MDHPLRSSRGYLRLREGWKRISTEGPGPFVTSEVLRRPDGTVVQWHSRAARKRHGGALGSPATGHRQGAWWRPDRLGWWIGILFAIGSLCFAVASIASQWTSTDPPWIGVTFFVGSVFFTSASYLQYAEAANVKHHVPRTGREAADPPVRRRWRVATWEPRRIDWLATAVQLVGTVFFNISTFAALNTALSTHQSNVRVWSPDLLGSACFLVASELAYAEVCHRWVCLRCRSLSWRIVALNLLGSLAFGVAAIAAFVRPATGDLLDTRLANAGTSLGALCFLLGALLLLPEADEPPIQASPQPVLQPVTPAEATDGDAAHP